MKILDDAIRERFIEKLAMIRDAQKNARKHIKDVDDREFNYHMAEAEQGIRDLERMIA